MCTRVPSKRVASAVVEEEHGSQFRGFAALSVRMWRGTVPHATVSAVPANVPVKITCQKEWVVSNAVPRWENHKKFVLLKSVCTYYL